MITYHLRADLGDGGSVGSVRVPQNDVNARRVVLTFTHDGAPYVPADTCTAVWEATLPGGAMLYNDCTLSDGRVSHVIGAAETRLAGSVPCRCVLYDGDGAVLCSPGAELIVEPALLADAAVEATDEFTALAAAMTQANAYRTRWSNPSVSVTTLAPAVPATAGVSIGSDGVSFSFGIPKGETGEPVIRGDEAGCLVETAENGALSAGRKLRVGTHEPSLDAGLRDGDLYVQVAPKEIVLYSSTAGSEKRFAITVDDSGTLTATEVTQGE